MSLLEVKNVKKIYTTRFGSNQVEALRDVIFTDRRKGLFKRQGSGEIKRKRDRNVQTSESRLCISGF